MAGGHPDGGPAIDLPRRLVAEALGTALLVAMVIGSGIMGERLAGGNDGIALLGNTLATGAGLTVLILVFEPLSGAHFNPVVTLSFALQRRIGLSVAAGYVAVQFAGGLTGTALGNLMFAEPMFTPSLNVRTGTAQWLGELVASFGLLATILGCLRARPEAVPWAVGLFIAAGYWFTSSTSFANPAVTVARALTDSFAGIRPADIPGFIAAQVVGALLATTLFGWLLQRPAPTEQAGRAPRIVRRAG